MKESLVYIIVLNYNGYKDTVECIESIKKINYKNFKILIVDNNSNDESVKLLKAKFNECLFIETEKNLGYAGGNNVGIKYALNNGADYICIVNNDVVVEKEFLDILVKYLDSNPNTAIIGPMVLEYNNSDEIVQSTGGNINIYKGHTNPINLGKKSKEIRDKIIKCDYVGGACILIKKDMILKLGLIPENYFLFYEETEWCLKAKKNGYDIICNLNSKVKHKGSASINKIEGLNEYFMLRNRVIFEKRNANKIQFTISFMYIFVETLYRILLRKQKLYVINYYIDGILNRINERYNLY